MTLSKDKGIIFLLLSPGNLTLSKLHRQAYTIQSQAVDIVASEGTARAGTHGPASVAGRGEVHTGTRSPRPNVPRASVGMGPITAGLEHL